MRVVRSGASVVPLIAALITLAVHLAGNAHYGFFRDELYFIVCGFHPDWGYVDQPPIVPLIAAGSQMFGHSLFLLRALAAIFAAASVYVTCLIAIELGGGLFAQVFAALVAGLAPVLMSFGMKISTDLPGLVLWPLTALLVLRIAKGGDPRLWLAAGAAVGVSFESKYSVLFFATSLIAGLLLVPERRILFTRWFALGAVTAVAIALPNLAWQAAHGFPTIELLRNGQMGKNVVLSPLGYLIAELVITNPLLAIVWIIGLVALFVRAQTRFLGISFVVLIALMIALHAKHYYPAAIYPILFAAGAVAIEGFTARRTFVRPVLAAFAAAAGLVLVPYVLPILPIPALLSYNESVKRALPALFGVVQTEHQKRSVLPQDWADMHDWPELAATVTQIYSALPPEQRAQAAIVANNYGEAAAIDFFGKDLPPVLSGHNNYWLWGTRGRSGDVVIDVNGDCGAKEHLFRSSRLAARFSNPLGMPYEDGIAIYVCTGIKVPLARLWPDLKNYI